MKILHRWIPAVALLAFASVSSPSRAATEKGWNITTLESGDYVTFDQIKKFYHFTSLKREDAKIVLENSKVGMQFEAGSADCRINGIHFILSTPVVDKGRKSLLSREDLSGLIDPVLRPDKIQAGKFDTVVLDAPRFGDHEGPDDLNGPAGKIAELTGKKLEEKGLKVVLRISAEAAAVALPSEKAIYLRISLPSRKNEANGVATTVGADAGASVALATAVHGAVVRKLGKAMVDAGIRRDPALLLPMAGQPSMVIEPGNSWDSEALRLIRDNRYQSAVADAIVQGILRYKTAIAGIPASLKTGD